MAVTPELMQSLLALPVAERWILARSEADVAAGRIRPADEVIAQLRSRASESGR